MTTRAAIGAPRARAIEHSGYRADIDGLRAVAVLSVVVFHAFPGVLPGGFVGVDVFFVISGFLISGILLGNLDRHGSLRLGDFYARRIRRIFPALLLVLAASLAFGWFSLMQGEFTELGKHVAGSAAFLSNVVLWQQAGYFAPAADTTPLLHLWSLAVEEQFYIVWPLLLLAVHRRRTMLVIAVVAAASFAAGLLMIESDQDGAFFLPLGRVWELALGAGLARMTLRPSVRVANYMAIVGAALIAAAAASTLDVLSYPGWAALVPTVGCALLIAAGPTTLVNKRLLASRGLVWIGRISYPLYLWHWPLLAFVALIVMDPSATLRTACVAVAVALAAATYAFVERPIRASSRPTTAWTLAGLMLLVGTLGVLAHREAIDTRYTSRGMLKSFPADGKDRSYPASARSAHIGGMTVHVLGADGDPGVLVVGDSFAQQYIPRAERIVNGHRVMFATHGGCQPIPGMGSTRYPGCQPFTKSVTDFALTGDGFDRVVFISSLLVVLTGSDPAYFIENGGERVMLTTPEGQRLMLAALNKWLAALKARGVETVLVLPQPISEGFKPSQIMKRTLFGAELSESAKGVRIEALQFRDESIRAAIVAIAKRNGATLIDPFEYLCREGICQSLVDLRPIYSDRAHLAASYVREHATFIDAAFDRRGEKDGRTP